MIAAVVGVVLSLGVALLAHGVFDFFPIGLIDNLGVPAWWPTFCLAYDAMAAAWLAGMLYHGKCRAKP